MRWKGIAFLPLAVALGACSGEDGSAQALFDEGSARIREGDYSGGVARLKVLLDEYPDTPVAAVVREDWAYYEELLRIEAERLPAVAAQDLRRIGTAVEEFRNRRGAYPARLEELVPGWIDSIPPDPWGRPYAYRREGRGYVIETLGEDGERGGYGQAGDIRVEDGRLRNAPPLARSR